MSALEAKFESSSHEQTDGGNKRKKRRRKDATTAKRRRLARGSKGAMKSECWHKQKDEAEAALQAIKERRERAGRGRQARGKPWRLVLFHVCKGARGKGERILLKGITGDTVNAERADVVFPITTVEGKRFAIFM